MQQNLDFKYGAGQKKWRVGGYLRKTELLLWKSGVSGKKLHIE